MQNPEIFTNSHYKQAAMAVAAGIAIRLIIAIPVCSSTSPNYVRSSKCVIYSD